MKSKFSLILLKKALSLIFSILSMFIDYYFVLRDIFDDGKKNDSFVPSAGLVKLMDSLSAISDLCSNVVSMSSESLSDIKEID